VANKDGRTCVLFVNTRSRFGAEVAVHLTIIRNLDPERCQVFLATNSRALGFDQVMEAVRDVPGLTVKVMNLGDEVSGRGKLGKLLSAASNAATLFLAFIRLTVLIRTRRIDVIHSTDRPRDALLSTLLARANHRKNILHLHIKWYPGMGRLTTWALEKCDAVIAISRFVRGSLLEGGVPDNKIYTAWNATDPVVFNPESHPHGFLRTRYNIPSDAPLLGIIARIMVWKGHLELIEALALVKREFPTVRLFIVGWEDTWMDQGEEGYGAQVRRRIEELGLTENVIWTGWIEEAPGVFTDLDMVCVPSYEEPFGLVVTEAMSMGRPVVGFNSGALPEIITHEQEGLLVTPKNTEELAAAIIRLLRDPEERRLMGQRGRQKVLKSFTPRHQADRVAEIYEAVVQGRPGTEFN
jgi:glycosyltransferase involved in cell wall biosynthesis